jgi:hypothetical protein
LLGVLGRWWLPASFPPPKSSEADASSEYLIDRLLGQGQLRHTMPSARRAVRILLTWLCWRSLKTDHLCSLKIDQGWKPRAAAPGVV